MRDGHGIYHFKNGARYDGEWKKGVKHGRGKFTYPDGSNYCGDWRMNSKNGFGKYLYDNLDVYEGSWVNDVKHGVGTYKFNEANITIKATWVEGTLKGPIEIFYPSFHYHGYWNQHHPVGEGVFSFSSKHMLCGHIDFFPNPDFVSNKNPKISSNEVIENVSEIIGSLATESQSREYAEIPRCRPEFVAHCIEPYNYSKLPQHPFPLPAVDSIVSTCSASSGSEVEVFQVQPPILITADPIDSDEEHNE